MRCFRCGGYMVYEKFYPPEVAPPFWGWRCINCGEIIDEVILCNRWLYGNRGYLVQDELARLEAELAYLEDRLSLSY